MESSVTLAGAVGAGLISFLSPCVLPLVPPYLAYLAGVSIEEYRGAEKYSRAWWRTILSAAAFVLGFSTVFVLLGATASALGQAVRPYMETIGYIAGALIILMGLHFLGVFRIPLLYREARISIAQRPAGPIGAYLVGLAFGFGWTPCIGPILQTILVYAASQKTLGEGVRLLVLYSLGLGIPFLAAAFFAVPFMSLMQRFRQHMGLVEKAMGVALVVAGFAFMTGQITRIGNWLLELFPSLAYIG